MNPAARIFADITAALEDMHGVAVEGQHPDLTADGAGVLAAGLRADLTRIDTLIFRAERRSRRP